MRTERITPDHRVASISPMTEIKRVGHFGNKTTDKVWISAIAVAGEDQDITANAFAFAIAANCLNASNTSVRPRQQCLSQTFGVMEMSLASAALRSRLISSNPVRVGKPCIRKAEWPG